MSAVGWIVVAFAVLALYYGVPIVVKAIQKRRLDAFCRAHSILVLTYDDGPSASLTPRLLELLEKHVAPATFFVLGDNADRERNLIDRITDAGHEVAPHSQRHRHAWKSIPGSSERDAIRGVRTLERLGSSSPFFRPPYGKLTLGGLLWAALTGRRLAWWTIDTKDYLGEGRTQTEITDAIRERGGGVVLMHDFHDSSEPHEARGERVLGMTSAILETAAAVGLRVVRFGDLDAGTYRFPDDAEQRRHGQDETGTRGGVGGRALGPAQPAPTRV